MDGNCQARQPLSEAPRKYSICPSTSRGSRKRRINSTQFRSAQEYPIATRCQRGKRRKYGRHAH